MWSNTGEFILYPRTRRKKHVEVTLKLTSMIDMFTILIVFLLKSFSAEGQIVTLTKDLRLPESTAQKAPQPASTVSITDEWILLDDEKVVAVTEVMSANSLIIPGLANGLKNLKTVSETIGQMSKDMGFTGKIAIQGDKEIPYELLKKVMFTCGQIGYNDILLTVQKME